MSWRLPVVQLRSLRPGLLLAPGAGPGPGTRTRMVEGLQAGQAVRLWPALVIARQFRRPPPRPGACRRFRPGPRRRTPLPGTGSGVRARQGLFGQVPADDEALDLVGALEDLH